MSVSRRCDYFSATDGKWYILLGDEEHAWEDHECTAYGPFESMQSARKYVSDNHSNPGSYDVYSDGTEAPPLNPISPDDSTHLSFLIPI